MTVEDISFNGRASHSLNTRMIIRVCLVRLRTLPLRSPSSPLYQKYASPDLQ